MKFKTLFFGMLSVLILFSFSAVYSQQGDQADMMKKWQEYMTPSAPHQALAKMVGTWKGAFTVYMGGQETKSDGTAMYEMILGGRYLKGSFTGNMMGMPFEGFELDGYDNASKEYLSVWLDNFGTGIMYLKGKMDEKTKNLVYTGSEVDPTTGKEIPVKNVIKIIDDDHQVMEMYMVEGGKEVKNMQVEYTRVK